jgi:hypothetical protein
MKCMPFICPDEPARESRISEASGESQAARGASANAQKSAGTYDRSRLRPAAAALSAGVPAGGARALPQGDAGTKKQRRGKYLTDVAGLIWV